LSVVGRFLEHSRVFYFRHGAEDPQNGEFYLGSADWMYRNLNARVEAIVPVDEPALRQRLWEILSVVLRDERQAWEMQSDGTYKQRGAGNSENSPGSHDVFMRIIRERSKLASVV
jgi:polyphosphate kinase